LEELDGTSYVKRTKIYANNLAPGEIVELFNMDSSFKRRRNGVVEYEDDEQNGWHKPLSDEGTEGCYSICVRFCINENGAEGWMPNEGVDANGDANTRHGYHSLRFGYTGVSSSLASKTNDTEEIEQYPNYQLHNSTMDPLVMPKLVFRTSSPTDYGKYILQFPDSFVTCEQLSGTVVNYAFISIKKVDDFY
jgi:hypothetical protein